MKKKDVGLGMVCQIEMNSKLLGTCSCMKVKFVLDDKVGVISLVVTAEL